MQSLSFAVEYAWRTAAEEALQAGAESIAPMHLLIGVCSIEKFFYQEKPTQLSGYALAALRFEWQEFVTRLTAAGSSPSALRRAGREALHFKPGVKATKNVKMSRSKESKALFDRADAIAKAAGSTVLGLVYLFQAMIEKDGPISELLSAQNVNLEKLRESTLEASKRPLQPPNLKDLQSASAEVSFPPPGSR